MDNKPESVFPLPLGIKSMKIWTSKELGQLSRIQDEGTSLDKGDEKKFWGGRTPRTWRRSTGIWGVPSGAAA